MIRTERIKELKGYGGRYMVGDLGHVYAEGFELSLIGGRYVNLSRKGIVERVDVGYLVARTFLPNLEGRPYVVHLDGDFRNNRVENLRWSEVPGRRRIAVEKDRRAVEQFVASSGEFVARYESLSEAADATGLARYLIRKCADGFSGRVKQWRFRYV